MSANPRPLVATIYNPHNQSKEALIAGFTARKAKFDRLFRDISEAPMTKAEQHYLVQGVRGMGKTTFLLRLAYEVQNTPDLAQRLIPIVFNEEEYGISSLADVWERTAQYLEESDPAFTGLLNQITAQYGGDEYERAALGTLLSTLRQHNKKLLLLIDNIGDLFRKFDGLENKRLREVLLTTPDLRLIGATSTLIEQTHEYSKPYFDFFRVVYLNGLNKTETNELFIKLGEIYGIEDAQELVKKRPGRIEALRRLTGGVIRTMVLLFEILIEDKTGVIFRDLNVLLDRVTPLYKHRMDDMSGQQQKIVAALATAWDAVSAKELADVLRQESKVISAQLTKLIGNSIVERIETNTKNNLYRLEERFFNIWYLMRFGRRTDQRVLWLIKFFELMFAENTEWMNERVIGHLQAMEVGSVDPEAALYLTTAFAGIVKDEELEDLLSKTTKLYLVTRGRQELAGEVGYSRYEKVTVMLNEQKYTDAISSLNRFTNKTLNVYLDLISCYLLLNRSDISSITYIDLLKYKNNLVRQLILALHARRFNNLIRRRAQSLPRNYIIYEDYVSVSINVKNPEDIKLVSSDAELMAEVMTIFFSKKISNRKFIAFLLSNHILYKNNISLESLNIITAINIIYLWNNNYELIKDRSRCPFYAWRAENKVDPYSNRPWLYTTFLKLLLAKKQYHTAYNYFQQEEWQLKDRFKPLYYATMFFLRDEYPTEYLRMGPELAETVQDILNEVEQMAIDYA